LRKGQCVIGGDGGAGLLATLAIDPKFAIGDQFCSEAARFKEARLPKPLIDTHCLRLIIHCELPPNLLRQNTSLLPHFKIVLKGETIHRAIKGAYSFHCHDSGTGQL